MKEDVTVIITTILKDNSINLAKPFDFSQGYDSRIFGRDGQLDSLSLVNLIVQVEEEIENKFGKTLVLADEKAMSQQHNPFKTIAVFADYISARLAEE